MQCDNLTKDYILDILNNLDENTINNLSTTKIIEHKKKILENIVNNKDELEYYLNKLSNYRYVDEIDEVLIGRYIRWFTIINPEKIKLTNGGIIIDIIYKNDNIILVCKNYINNIFSLKLKECLVFQKFTSQEELIIEILDYIKI